MKVLHICSNYIGSKLYNNLFNKLSEINLNQTVFVPIYRDFTNLQNSDKYIIRYSKVLNVFSRVLYFYKIKKIFNNLIKDKTLVNMDFIHAHTFFSDGGVAYLLNKKYKIPYIVAVRNTDINTFLKFKKYLRYFGKHIINNANSIVFLSDTYKEKFIRLMPRNIRDEIEKKSVVIPNGIDDFWISNCKEELKKVEEKINLLFVGSIDKNKNLKFNIEIIKNLKEKKIPCFLHIVGDGSELNKCIDLVNVNHLENEICFHGKIIDRNSLKAIMGKCNIFLLNSKYESFGLVYAESLSQGLNLLYTRNQGFDRQFEEGEVGYSVKYNDIDECIDRIMNLYMLNSVHGNNKKINEYICRFNWIDISIKYKNLYINSKEGCIEHDK